MSPSESIAHIWASQPETPAEKLARANETWKRSPAGVKARAEWAALTDEQKAEKTRKLDATFRTYKENDTLLEHLKKSPEDAETREHSHFLGGPMQRFDMGGYNSEYHADDCDYCGEAVVYQIGTTTIRANTACPHPGAHPVYHVWVNIPSGEIVFGNDFRDLCEVNYAIERGTRELVKCSEVYASQGMVHIFVGNTCPQVVQVSEDHLLVGNDCEGGYDDVGSIDTSLWWYSAMDRDEFERRAGYVALSYAGEDAFTVRVEPGCYRVSGQHHLTPEANWANPARAASADNIYSTWVREGPCRELEHKSRYVESCERMKDVDFAVAALRFSWPSSHPDRLACLADLCCSEASRGRSWVDGNVAITTNGQDDAMVRIDAGEMPSWTLGDLSPRDRAHEERTQDTAELRERMTEFRHFITLGKSSPLCTIPDNVAPKWLDAAEEVAQAIVTQGNPPRGTHAKRAKTARSNVRLARKALKRIGGIRADRDVAKCAQL